MTRTPTNGSAVYWSRDTDGDTWPVYCTAIGESSGEHIGGSPGINYQLYRLKMKNYKIQIRMGANLSFLGSSGISWFSDWLHTRGVLGGGRAPRPPPYAWSPWGGWALMGGGGLFKYYICLPFPCLGNLHSNQHCIALTQTKRLRKEKNIFWFTTIYPSKLCLVEHCIKYPCFPIGKLIIFICGFSTKVTHAFLASETMDKWRFQRCIGHATL